MKHLKRPLGCLVLYREAVKHKEKCLQPMKYLHVSFYVHMLLSHKVIGQQTFLRLYVASP